MRKAEVISLVFVLAAVGVLVIALQMDYGNSRKWMLLLFIVLLVLAIDPKHFLKRKQKPKAIDYPAETEEDETGFIDLTSAAPVGKKTLNHSDAYLTFLDKESDDYYYIHYVANEADEIYIGRGGLLTRQSLEDLYDGYETLDYLLEAAENGEIDDFCTISAEDFAYVRTRYQDSWVDGWQTSFQDQSNLEPVNRVGKAVDFLFLAFAFVLICVAISILPFMTEVDGGTYIGIFFFSCFVLLVAVLYSFSPTVWLERRIKWLSGSANLKVKTFGQGKEKSRYAESKTDHIIYEYHPWEKLLMITKTIQMPLDNVRHEYEQKKRDLEKWIADKPFIEHSYLSDLDSLGKCYFYFTIPKADATKAAMRILREWIFLPEYDSTNVCEYFKIRETEGTFFVKFCLLN
ncbi:MAG: hypothetical protein IJ159_03020 [Prevotella sp.]|nr:hypothetical protein [Prevotella sp.]